MFSTGALTPASVSPVISPGRLAFRHRCDPAQPHPPIADSIFEHPPKFSMKTNSKLQAQYRRTTKSFNDLIVLLKAA